MNKYNYTLSISAFTPNYNEIEKSFKNWWEFKNWMISKEFSKFTKKNEYNFTFNCYITKPEEVLYEIKFWDSKNLKKFGMSVDGTEVWWR